MNEYLIKIFENRESYPELYNAGCYRIYNELTNKSYIGSASESFMYRLFYGKGAHYKALVEGNFIKYVHSCILSEGLEKFRFEILSDNVDDEEYYIEKFDSFNNGYNRTRDGKSSHTNYVPVSNGIEMKLIHPNDVDSFLILNKGYFIGFDLTWITNGVESKRVKSSELDYYLSIGYKLGVHFSTKGKVRVTNGSSNTSIDESQLQDYLSSGYWIGITLNCEPMTHMYLKSDESIEKFIPNSMVDDYKSNGWEIGSPRMYGNQYGKVFSSYKWLSDGTYVKRLPESDAIEFLKNNPDWHYGRK